MVGCRPKVWPGAELLLIFSEKKKIKRLDQEKIKSSRARDNCEGVKAMFNT